MNPEQYKSIESDTITSKNAEFSKVESAEIEQKRQILSSLAYFIGKDFNIPVELNKPGDGWHWDFKENKIRIDPKDLLAKPMDYLRFVISHEAGHRRISRTEFIPLETWQQPGFSFMMNAIEDPRDNNFVAEAYPKFAEQMQLAYQEDLELEKKSKEKAQQKLGYTPRFMQAGFEYIKQWFRERQNQDFQISDDLQKDVKEVIKDTLNYAQDSWWRYPSRTEADDPKEGENTINKYAQVSYDINNKYIWPEFKKLVDKDREDQKMQELMKDMKTDKEEGQGQGLPEDLKDKLNPEEQKELEEAINKALEETKPESDDTKDTKGKEEEQKEREAKTDTEERPEKDKPQKESKGKPIDLDSLSEELKKKIKEYVDSLPENQKKELQEKAQKSLSDFEKDLNQQMEGKLSDNPEKKQKREESKKDKDQPKEPKEQPKLNESQETPKESQDLKKYRELIEQKLNKDLNVYEQYRREVLPIIDKLEQDLREIFVSRRNRKWLSGFKYGKKIDIKKRIQEKAKKISAMESKAWQKRELPQEKDYAITLLIDLSGSMRKDNKIKETFKSTIVLAEALNRLSIKTEILGFNEYIYEYQKFNQSISKEIRENMGGMLKEVSDFGSDGHSKALYNDDGWALEQASERLAKQKEKEKFIIVLSDGNPEESPQHSGSEYDLKTVVNNTMKNTDQKLIGLGLLSSAVSKYYPNYLADLSTQEMAEKLSQVIKDAIANYTEF